MKIAVTGATGMVGSALSARLKTDGHEIVPIGRRATEQGSIMWDVEQQKLDGGQLSGIEAVVHLAGEGIASGRWNAAKKTRIRDSRVRGTELLSKTLATMIQPPRVLVAASAIGFYGDRGDYVCDDTASAGTGFLADVCEQWEAATEPAMRAGIRVVNLRIGIVLSKKGGALVPMLLPFKLGVGGRVGSGSQYWSWITLDDLLAVIAFALRTDSLRGPVNAVAPNPVSNIEFTKALGAALHRPTIFPMPAFAARLALGEMADALIMASTRVVPQKLLDAGFQFSHTQIVSALRYVLSQP